MKRTLLSALTIASLAVAASSQAAPFGTTYAIDFDSTRGGSGPVNTAPGFTSLNVDGGGGSSVVVDGINFEIFSTPANASRRRGNANPITRDFVFEEGPNNAAVGILIGGAGDLDAGLWRVEVWAWDNDVQNALPDFIIGSRRNGSETIYTTTFPGDANDPFTFIMESDGIGAYDVFVRENNAGNRARMNGIRLTAVPEPTSLIIGAAGLGLCALRRRRSH